MANQFPKQCACGASYGAESWAALALCGEQAYPWGEVIEYRHCTCHSTIGVVLVDGDPGDAWAEAEERSSALIACCATCSRVDVLVSERGRAVCTVCKVARTEAA